jgi:5-oxoprolinase (ATP-hydrolysing) subunit C
MSLRVLQPGAFSLLVDAGRPRSRRLGVPLGGAADRAAYAIGNALAGNAPNALALEITLSGPTLLAEHDVSACLFGASFTLSAGDRDVEVGRTFQLRAGDVMRVGGAQHGARAYLCVRGGFQAKVILDSASGLAPLAANDCLNCAPSAGAGLSLGAADAASLFGEPTTGDELHVVDGPQADWFAGADFYDKRYLASPASNRMGVRLDGAPLARPSRELVSEAIAPGAVQVANDGLPIIIGVDGQTIGGYPKIAHVIRADLDRIAQLRPGQIVRFVRVNRAEAESRAQQRQRQLRRWLTALRLANLP